MFFAILLMSSIFVSGELHITEQTYHETDCSGASDAVDSSYLVDVCVQEFDRYYIISCGVNSFTTSYYTDPTCETLSSVVNTAEGVCDDNDDANGKITQISMCVSDSYDDELLPRPAYRRSNTKRRGSRRGSGSYSGSSSYRRSSSSSGGVSATTVIIIIVVIIILIIIWCVIDAHNAEDRAQSPRQTRSDPGLELQNIHDEPRKRNVTSSKNNLQVKSCEHRLKEFTTPNSFTCDVCFTAVPPQTTMYGCRICNYDKCTNCYSDVDQLSPVSVPARKRSADVSAHNQSNSADGTAHNQSAVPRCNPLPSAPYHQYADPPTYSQSQEPPTYDQSVEVVSTYNQSVEVPVYDQADNQPLEVAGYNPSANVQLDVVSPGVSRVSDIP